MLRLYKLPFQILLASLLLLLPTTVFCQKSIEIGFSCRYVYFEEADWSLTHARSEALQPHELDLNIRFGIGDPNLRGTFTLGYAKFRNADFTFTNLLFSTCENVTCNGYTQNLDAYRFNPEVEYQIKKGKLNYGLGAGIFYCGAFGGKKEQLLSEF